MKIFALGPEGTFGHMAAKQVKTLKPEWANQDFSIDFAPTHTEVLKRATSENAFGVIAIRNSLSNNVPDSTAYLAQMPQNHPLTILTELWLKIEQCLLVRKGVTSLAQITRIASFPQASDQCTRRIAQMATELIPARSTADAARQAAQDASGATAAIGNTLAAQLQGLEVFERGIQDDLENETLFWVFGPRDWGQFNLSIKGAKSVMVFHIEDRIGSLANLVNPLDKNATNIEHVYTYRRGQALKFMLELIDGQQSPDRILAERAYSSIVSMVELGRFTV